MWGDLSSPKVRPCGILLPVAYIKRGEARGPCGIVRHTPCRHGKPQLASTQLARSVPRPACNGNASGLHYTECSCSTCTGYISSPPPPPSLSVPSSSTSLPSANAVPSPSSSELAPSWNHCPTADETGCTEVVTLVAACQKIVCREHDDACHCTACWEYGNPYPHLSLNPNLQARPCHRGHSLGSQRHV